MITITAPEKATQQLCGWLRSRPRGVVLYEFGHIDIVCTRASNIGTSKKTHTDAHRPSILFMTWGEGVPKNRE